MVRVTFTANLRRHVACPPLDVDGTSVRDCLDAYFGIHPAVRSYVVDEHGHVRKHVAVFIGSDLLTDRDGLGDAVADGTTITVMQALSGG